MQDEFLFFLEKVCLISEAQKDQIAVQHSQKFK